MRWLAFSALSIAVVLGGAMIAGHWRRAAVLHGMAGFAGLAALATALAQGRLRGAFAWDAAVLAGMAFAGGLMIYTLAKIRRPRPALLVLLHAMAGGLAYLLLAGFVFTR